MEKILVGVTCQMTVSKVEGNKFRYTGLDAEVLGNSIKISMQQYVNTLEIVEDIRKTDTV